MTTRREEFARLAANLRAAGCLQREIAEALGISRGYACELLRDPTGALAWQRKQSYGGTCVGCGRRTDGSNGRKKASKRCAKCAREHQTTTEHGTPAMYDNHQCRCDICRHANAARKVLWSLHTTAPIPHGTYGGYSNHGCRCDLCRDAHNAGVKEIRARRLASGQFKHGRTGYAYGCKCDECRAAAREYGIEYRRVRREREAARSPRA